MTAIFHGALERPSDQRPSFLVEACRRDSSLRADVDALLSADRRADATGDPLAPVHAALSPGTLLGPYRVDALLDAGGMGEVYRACDTRLNRDVAIKVLPAGATGDPDRLLRFEREGRAAAALNHPNICAIFDVGVHEGAPFIVSELLQGETLRDACAAGPLTVRRALEYGLPIAQGLAAAHGKGIVHRDLKPENVFITTEGRVKILDFGLATPTMALAADTPVAGADRLTDVGMVIGTVGYMSPEQVRGLPADGRSDIFGFGTVLFEMLAGRHPFRGGTPVDTFSAILREEPPALMRNGGVPPDLDRIVRRCLEKAPANRFQSADDLAFALGAVSLRPATDGAPISDVQRLRVWSRRAVVALAAAAAAAAAVGYFAMPPSIDVGAYRFTPFATEAGATNDAAWSPDGRSIAYDMAVNRRTEIFVRSLDSDTPAQITHGSDDAQRPFWWPDGTRVGFVSAGAVWSVSRAGGAPELVQHDWVGAAALSPDGQTLATWRTNSDRDMFDVWLASPPNAVPREYSPAPFKVKGWFWPNYLQFSPDGAQLLLSDFSDSGEVAIWVLPFPDKGSQPHRVFPRIPRLGVMSEDPQLAWMPDSRRAVMVFPSASAPKGGLWLADVRTGAATPLIVGPVQQSNPSVSPDGSKIAFTVGGPRTDLVEVPLDGSPMRDFLATDNDEYSGAWVPGSSRYVYLTNKNGDEELRVHSQTENWDRLILAGRSFGEATVMGAPVASPDGQRVAFHVWGGNGVSSIWISPIGGGAAVEVTRDGAAERAPEWSPDGRSIACNHEEDGVVGLAIIRVGSGDPPRVLAHGIAGIIPAWSPDGQWIAYQTNEVVALVSPDGSRRRTLTASGLSRDLTEHGWGSALVWSRDSSRLYSIRRAADRTVQMVAIDAVSGAVRVVSTLGADFYFGTPTDPGLRFTLAPDGRSFLATLVRTRTNLWILENFAPRAGLLDWFRRRP